MECQGKMPRAVTRKAESTDVHVCGGLPRSSVEVSVMGMERRGQRAQPNLKFNSINRDETMNEAAFVITIKLTQSKSEDSCEGRLSSTVLREAQGEVPWAYLLNLKLQINQKGVFFYD